MDKPTDRKFVVIDGSPAPDTPKERVLKRLRSQAGPPNQVRCHRCTGLAFIEVRLGMTYRKDRKPSGGQRQYVCVTCLQGGEYVVW